jgi:hypothetical protein
MINAQQAFHRVKALEAFRHMNESDFRALTYNQIFTPAAGGVPTAITPQPFPGGAIILGITASAYVPGAVATGQGGRNRQLFLIDFAFSNNEAIVVGGPVIADALLGGGESDIFPSKEMVLNPNQSIGCRTANITTGSLIVHVVYHALIYRFAS